MTQKPAIGNIVIYFDGTQTLPAIVIRVWTDECVNLVVFQDGPYPTSWESSVSYQAGDFPAACSWQWPEGGHYDR